MALTNAERQRRYRERAKNANAFVKAAEAELHEERKKRRATEAELEALKRDTAALEGQIKLAIRLSPDRGKVAAALRRVAMVLALTPKGRQRARKRDLRRYLLELMQKVDEQALWFENNPGQLLPIDKATGEATRRGLTIVWSMLEFCRACRERNVPPRAFIK